VTAVEGTLTVAVRYVVLRTQEPRTAVLTAPGAAP